MLHKPDVLRFLATLIGCTLYTLYSAYSIAEQHTNGSLSINSTLEIVAALNANFKAHDNTLVIFDYHIIVDSNTRFLDKNANPTTRFTASKHQWLSVKAKKLSDGRLLAIYVQQAQKQPLSVLILEDEFDKQFFPRKTEDRRQPLKTFLEDESESVAFSFRPYDNVWIGGNLDLEWRDDDERDLNKAKKRDKTTQTAELRLNILWKFNGSGSFLLFEPSQTYTFSKDELNTTEEDHFSRLSRFYVYYTSGNGYSLQLGRQDFDEEREWLYDEILDAIKLKFRNKKWNVELSHSQGRKFLDEINDTQDIENIIFDLRYYFRKNHFISAWHVTREDSSDRNINPRLTGIRSISQPRKGFQHWVDVAYADGEMETYRLGGFGIDLGVGHITEGKNRTYTALSVAYASASTEKVFRQAGLQGNSDKLGGLVSYAYYGELLDPELANLTIYSMFFGIRPSASFSFDIAVHCYNQVQTGTTIINTRLKASPNGTNKEIGCEADLISAIRAGTSTLQLIAGHFNPGKAFDKQDPANILKLKLEVKF